VDCCEIPSNMNSAHDVASPLCRACGMKGKKVGRVTLEHIVKRECLSGLSDTQYYFCVTPSCEVIYFSNEVGQSFIKGEVRVRVGIKETQDPILICYCFNHTAASLREEIERTGKSTAVASITAEIQAGNCACEIKNPLGICCLVEVSKAVKAIVGK
jgi:hypothetical protein